MTYSPYICCDTHVYKIQTTKINSLIIKINTIINLYYYIIQFIIFGPNEINEQNHILSRYIQIMIPNLTESYVDEYQMNSNLTLKM